MQYLHMARQHCSNHLKLSYNAEIVLLLLKQLQAYIKAYTQHAVTTTTNSAIKEAAIASKC